MPKSDLLEATTITDAEIADLYGVHPSTVRRWAALKRLPPPVGPGRRKRRSLEAVRRMLSGEGAVA